MNNDLHQFILTTIEASLEAQLKAIRKLKGKPPASPSSSRKKRRSNLGMVEDVLREAAHPLHINVILERIRAQFGLDLDRDSLVSSLTKKVLREDSFSRPDKNTFWLLEREQP